MMAGEESSSLLEQEIAQLEQDLASRRSELEKQKQSGEIIVVPHEKESLYQVVGEKFKSGAIPPAPSPQLPATNNQLPVTSPGLPSNTAADLKDKVQELVDVAFAKSIDDAVKLARATGNAALIDAFHDALVDELYNHLVERGQLKKL